MEPTGHNLIAGEDRAEGTTTTRSVDPRTGEAFGPDFHDATDAEVADAVAAAVAAAPTLRHADPATIARLLDAVATELEDLGDTLLDTADRETGLGTTRLTGERARTCAQLRAFAALVEDGSHLDVRIDRADPDATPPRPDLRRTRVALGPVAVFGASNFPFAFSVPGGDTASALAAGCPVVAKAHPAHPATSELCGRAIAAAVAEVGLPVGTFSLVHGREVEVARALVLAEGIEAVGFTGSEAAGRALFDLGAGRQRPIPVFAEMGSLNPQVVTERALVERGEEVASGLTGSMTMGTGQFCTKPGVVVVPDSPAGRSFEDRLVDAVAEVDRAPMLHAGIRDALSERLATTAGLDGVEVLVAEPSPVDDGTDGDGGSFAAATVLATDAATFVATPELHAEHFGPVVVLVRAADTAEVERVLDALPGSLTACLHGTDDDVAEVGELVRRLAADAGRVAWNQFPTGVAVAPAMHHGGPWPATTSASHTSVGTAAIERFLRPVCLQNVPQALLPPELRDDNPRGLLRQVDGAPTRDPLG